MSYLEYYRSLNLDSRLIDIASGDIKLPFRPVQPPREKGFPPALLPLWFEEGNFVGIWAHWFVDRAPSFVQLYSEEGWFVSEIARNVEQFLCLQILEYVSVNGDGPELSSFAEKVRLGSEVPYLASLAERYAGTFEGLLEHPLFAGGKAPLKCYEELGAFDEYTGDFPVLTKEFSEEFLSSCCGYETNKFSDQWQARLSGCRQPPPWLKNEEQADIFKDLLGKSDFKAAWMSLNSVGWSYGDAKRAILDLADAAKDAKFSEFAHLWATKNHEEYDSF